MPRSPGVGMGERAPGCGEVKGEQRIDRSALVATGVAVYCRRKLVRCPRISWTGIGWPGGAAPWSGVPSGPDALAPRLAPRCQPPRRHGQADLEVRPHITAKARKRHAASRESSRTHFCVAGFVPEGSFRIGRAKLPPTDFGGVWWTDGYVATDCPALGVDSSSRMDQGCVNSLACGIRSRYVLLGRSVCQ
jgi:hypothetical protein